MFDPPRYLSLRVSINALGARGQVAPVDVDPLYSRIRVKFERKNVVGLFREVSRVR